MAGNTKAGKAFEYAILETAYTILSKKLTVNVIQDSSYLIAQECFKSYSPVSQAKYCKAAQKGIDYLILLEPRLDHPTTESDILDLQLSPDNLGVSGDVRDILFIRSSQGWEIGVSAKNNHKAVKHPRLSPTIDFGKKWYGINCSETYWQTINPIFSNLNQLRKQGINWSSLTDKLTSIYIPLITAFRNEIILQNLNHPGVIPAELLKYLLGIKDFYKIIKGKRVTTIYGFNLDGTLNQPAGNVRSSIRVPRIHLPTMITSIRLNSKLQDTVNIDFDLGWQLSFRIHNASLLVEPSLKFDINIIGQHQNLHTQHISW